MPKRNKRVTIDEMRRLLVQYILDKKKQLCKEFTPKLTSQQIQKATKKAGWQKVEIYPAAYHGEIIYEFSHNYFSGKMRGYIYLDITRRKVENIVVQGE